MVSDVIKALQRSWRLGYYQTSSMLLASDGSVVTLLFSSNGEIDYGIDFVYKLYVTKAHRFAYTAVIINATGSHLACTLHREQGDPEAPLFRKYGENDRLEYYSDSLDMIYSWVARVLHTLRREAEGK